MPHSPAQPDALIGKTGFVGGTLARQHRFGAGFNRSNITQAHGAHFDTLICAAAPGSMFEANRFPKADAAAIDTLIETLRQVRADRLVLISTIAVLADFAGGDNETTTAFQADLAYGRNRRRLESFCADHFAACTILRLPALFGPGLRKNFLFDILNPVPSMLTEARLAQAQKALPGDLGTTLAGLYRADPKLGLLVVDRTALAALPVKSALETTLVEHGLSALSFTHPRNRFQYYDMSGLWADITRAVDAALPVLHLAPEPLEAGQVYHHLTGQQMPENSARQHSEDMHTAHAGLWGRSGPYSAGAAETLDALSWFFTAERGAAA